MSEELSIRVRAVIAARLQAFNIVESIEIESITQDTPDAKCTALLNLRPIPGKVPGSLATQANALALRVISALSTATEDDVWCSVSSIHMRPLIQDSIAPEDSPMVTLPLLAAFNIAA